MALSLSVLSFAPSKPSLGGFGPILSRCRRLRPSSLDHRLPADPFLSLRHSKKRKSPRRNADCSAGGVGGFANVLTASADYYSTLGVPRSANNKEIRAAYRRLARQGIDTNASAWIEDCLRLRGLCKLPLEIVPDVPLYCKAFTTTHPHPNMER